MSQDKRSGFTLVELAMAMAFVSMLLILITMTVIQISNIYNRGITVKEVNQVGRSLIDDIKRTISQSAGFSLIDGEKGYVELKDASMNVVGGRLCTRTYSYIWNFAKVIAGGTPINKYDGSTKVISFVKVSDNNASMCTSDPVSGNYPLILPSSASELLNAGDRRLALHNFNISLVEKDNTTSQQLYRIEFMIGTNNQEEIVSDQCKASGNSSDSSYCALNKFTLTVRAGNKSS